MLFLMAIIEKAEKLREEDNGSISSKGNCAKNEIPEIELKYSATASKSKQESSIEKAKEGNWILYIDGSKSEKRKVSGGYASYRRNIQGQVELGKLVTVWDEKIKEIAEGIIDWHKAARSLSCPTSEQC